MKILFLFIAIICTTIIAGAQTRIGGSVKTAKGEPIVGASLSIKGSYDGGSSDATGKFSFVTTEKGPQVLLFTAMGYEADSVKIEPAGVALSLNLVLKEKVSMLNAVTIVSGVFEASNTKKGVVLSALDVATTAGAQADVFAAMRTLPGTQPSFAENGLFVRGGSAAETKTFFDGMLVHDPYGIQLPERASRGKLSPFMFKGTAFSAGGYSALYGQALSSAMILETKDLPAKTTTGISVMTPGLGITHTHRFEQSSLALDMNYYNLKPIYNTIQQHTNWDKTPEGINGSLHYKQKVGTSGMFKFYSEYSTMNVGLFTPNIDNFAQNDLFTNHNKYGFINTSYSEYLSQQWKLDVGASYSNNDDHGFMQGDTAYKRNDALLQGRAVVTDYFGKLSTLKFGTEAFALRRKESKNQLSHSFDDLTSASFIETDLYFTEKLLTRVGLRAEHTSYLNKWNLAPRLSLAYRASKNATISTSYGQFYQTPVEGQLILSKNLGFEKATHYMATYQYMSDSRTFRIEAYYKDYANLVKTNAALPYNGGAGYAKGIDVFWRDKQSIKNVDYWVSYSYLDTKRNFLDYPYAVVPPFGNKHTLNVVYKQFISKINSQVGATYTASSGRSYYNPNNPEFMGDRTKTYQDLSLDISYLTHLFKQFTVIYASVSNVPGFNNVYGYQYSSNGMNSRPLIPGAKRNFFVGVFITIGDNTFVK